MIVEELFALLGFKMEGEQNLKRFAGGLHKATGALGAFAARAAVFSAAVATTIGAGLGALGKMSIDVGAEFEDLSAVLETIEGSSEKAKESLGWVEAFATKTPYELKEVADAFVRLKANGLDPQAGLLESLGNASSAMGKSLMDGVEMMADAVRGEGERLKEFGVTAEKAGKKITYNWSVNGKNMTKTVTKDAAAIQKALQDIFDSRFLGAMEKRSGTFNGIIANIGDIWTSFLRRIADAGWFDWVKGQFKSFLDTLQVFIEDGTIDRLAKKISGVLVETGQAVKALFRGLTVDDIASALSSSLRFMTGIMSFVRSIGQAVKWLGEFTAKVIGLESAWQGLMVAVAVLGAIFAPVYAAIAGVMLLVDDFIAWFEKRPSLIGWILRKIEGLFRRFDIEIDLSPEAIGKAIGSVVGTLKSAYKSVGNALDKIKGLIDRVTLSETFQSWAETSERFGNGIAALAKGVWDANKALVELFSSIGSGDGSGGGSSALASLAQQLGGLTNSTLTAGLKILQGAFESMANVFSTFGKNLSQLAEGDHVAFVRTLAEGVQRGGQIIKETFEGVVRAFAPDFSFMDAWNRVVAFFETFVAKIEAIVGKIEALAKRIADAFNTAIPEQPQWWKDVLDKNEGRKNLSEAGAAIGGMVPPKKTPGDQSMQNVDSLLTAIASAASKIEAITGASAIGEAVGTIANDNRVTDNRVFSAPVSIKATITNGTPEQIGAAAGGAVRKAMGDASVRNLAVTANPGGMTR